MKILDQNLLLNSQTQFYQRSERSEARERYLGGQLVSREGERGFSQNVQLQHHHFEGGSVSSGQSQHSQYLAERFSQTFSPPQNSNATPQFSHSELGAWNRFVAPNLQTKAMDSSVAPMPEHLLKMVEVIERMMERLTGQPYRLQVYGYERGDALSGEQASVANDVEGRRLSMATAGPLSAQLQTVEGERSDQQSQYLEREQMRFAASGEVTTEDGRQIAFDFTSSVSREFMTQNRVEVVKGLVVTDPLVVNFGGQSAQLTLDKVQFDLDSDDRKESMHFVQSGSGFLALDKNGNGLVDNGSELFGPESGNGFAELAAYDEDGNGWIDENDAVFAKLKLWHQDRQGLQQLDGLLALNVGAIALQNVSSEFTYKDDHNQAQAQIKASSVFLKEDGGVGSVQQVDLVI